MTIVTKPQQEKKENEENKSKFEAVILEEKVVPTPTLPPVKWRRSSTPEWYVAWRRRRLLTSLCAVLLILWLLLAAVIGGILLFRYMHRRPVFYGWCGTDYVNDRGDHYQKLREKVEVEDDNEGYEKIEIPEFGPGRPAIFIHDFRNNLSAVVDVEADQCFIKKLDRSQVSPPTSFIDLVRKMENGYYETTPKVIREEYRARLPALSRRDLRDLHSWMIERQCLDRVTYRLVKASSIIEEEPLIELSRKKRSAGSTYAQINQSPSGEPLILEWNINP